ncbi:MAG: helix-turn-helix domain-containing protein [Chloroflexi bacterium]|nr:helix-turn-helix domain-containing protein [Chloroflexota bacterium]
MQSVLGGIIKAHRLRRGMSQSELSAEMGWNTHPSRLSRYEQGRVVPNRATLDRLSAALRLAPDERGRMFMEAGYVPTDAEVSEALRELQPFMDGWKGPAYLTDFSWRFLGWNGPVAKLFGFPPDELSRLPQEKPTLLDFTFDEHWAIRRQIPREILVPFARGQVARFKAQQRNRTGQRWYRQLMKRLMPVPLFRELWRSTPAELGSELMDYNRVQLDSPVGRLDFHMFASAVVSDPRLFVILWLPADASTARLLP